MRSLVSKSTSYLPSFFFTLMLSACGGGGGGDSQSLAVNSDRDSDGVLNSLDVFPDNASESLDTDSDGVGNNADTDDDGDGVADTEDIFPLDSSESRDTDSDGVGNNADDDDDNDGVLDSEDIFPLNSSESRDTDSDGLGNNGDDDDDNDGVSDSLDAFPLDANESVDSDGDGVGNNADTDDDNDGVEDVSDDFPEDETRSATPTISLTVLEENAYEANNQLGKFQIQRTGDPMELDIVFQISGNEDSTRGSVSDVDFSLSYGNGDGVGTTLKLAENQNFRVIEVLATQDGLKEVPETLTLTLKLDEGYELGTDVAGSVIISDASNAPENGRVFLGTFGPQDAADTTASGFLSFVLQGDNDGGVLNYNFSNLGSIRTDQHIHMLPSGTIVRDIEESLLDEDGHLSSFTWDMAPGGIYTTEQQVLDALFDGKFYINIHTADYPNGEISATLVFDANNDPVVTETPVPRGMLIRAETDSDIINSVRQGLTTITEANAAERALSQPSIEVVASDSVATSSGNYTTTYTLEKNVDEHDYVKYDGDHMFIAPSKSMDCCFIMEDAIVEEEDRVASSGLSLLPPTQTGERTIRILKTEPVSASIAQVSAIELDTQHTVEGLYVSGSQLVAISSSGWWGSYGSEFLRQINCIFTHIDAIG